jgi:hypothetical protein
MSESKIRRKNKTFPVTLDNATASSTTIVLSDMAGGIVSLGTHNTNATELRVWVAADAAGPFRALKDKEATAVKLSLVGTTALAYTLPDEVFAAPFIKLQLNNTAADGLAATVMAKG